MSAPPRAGGGGQAGGGEDAAGASFQTQTQDSNLKDTIEGHNQYFRILQMIVGKCLHFAACPHNILTFTKVISTSLLAVHGNQASVWINKWKMEFNCVYSTQSKAQLPTPHVGFPFISCGNH